MLHVQRRCFKIKKTVLAIAAAAIAVALAMALIYSPIRQAEDGPSVTADITHLQPSPTPTPTPTVSQRAEMILAGMTPEEKVWQMMYVFPQDIADTYTSSDRQLWTDALAQRCAGGIIISTENMASPDQLKELIAAILESGDICPFVGVDEEGGVVERLAYTLGVTPSLKPMYTYRELGTDTAYSNAAALSGGLTSFGFNQDFAPVADVWTNSENTVIGKRAYSDDPLEAAELVAAAVRGFNDSGIIPTLKHFPGHGDTAQDSHYAAASSGKTVQELRECEFLPFISGIEAGAGMVMAGHICLPEVDGDVPATLSSKIIGGLLRDELGWDGVVITDSFAMAAITDSYTQTDAAVLAVKAGCDIILGAQDPDSVVAAILENIPSERIDESVLRILTLKLERNIISP